MGVARAFGVGWLVSMGLVYLECIVTVGIKGEREGKRGI